MLDDGRLRRTSLLIIIYYHHHIKIYSMKIVLTNILLFFVALLFHFYNFLLIFRIQNDEHWACLWSLLAHLLSLLLMSALHRKTFNRYFGVNTTLSIAFYYIAVLCSKILVKYHLIDALYWIMNPRCPSNPEYPFPFDFCTYHDPFPFISLIISSNVLQYL